MSKGLSAEELRRAWNIVCQEYLSLFCRKHGYNYADACVSWIGDIGEYVTVGDFVVHADTIRADIDFEAPSEAFLQWYDEGAAAYHNGDSFPAYRVWLQDRHFRKDEVK